MNIIAKINEISEKAKNKFKPDLKKYGKNFRAISESAVLEVLNPLFKDYNIAYDVLIESNELKLEKVMSGRDVAGNLIETLVFVASVVVRLVIRSEDETIYFDGFGSGVDSGDKATGKAMTAAVKYALFKGFRLQYSDDPDADASENIESIVPNLEGAGEGLKEIFDNALDEIRKLDEPFRKEKKVLKDKKEEPVATKAQLDYVKGLALACQFTDEQFEEKYGCLPYDPKMSMRKARELIEELKKLQDEKLPF